MLAAQIHNASVLGPFNGGQATPCLPLVEIGQRGTKNAEVCSYVSMGARTATFTVQK
jgi:hypothetical protein